MPSSWVERRKTKGGTGYRVKYRAGGRESVPRYAGAFRTMREARIRRDWIAGELAALIDFYLAEAAQPAFDQERFDRFRQDPRWNALVDRLVAPSLEDFRTQAEVTKQQVGDLLANEFGLGGHAQGFKKRYHDLETGGIAPERIATSVWSTLANAFGESVERLKDAAASARSTAGPDEVVAFARDTQAIHQGAQLWRAGDGPGGPEETDPVDAAFFQEEGDKRGAC